MLGMGLLEVNLRKARLSGDLGPLTLLHGQFVDGLRMACSDVTRFRNLSGQRPLRPLTPEQHILVELQIAEITSCLPVVIDTSGITTALVEEVLASGRRRRLQTARTAELQASSRTLGDQDGKDADAEAQNGSVVRLAPREDADGYGSRRT